MAAATSYDAKPQSSALRFNILTQKHPYYRGDLWRELGLLYRGGFDVAQHAKHFLPPLRGEPVDAYENRLKSCSYIGYLGQIIDYFSAALFQEPLQVTSAADAGDDTTPGTEVDSAYYGKFSNDADLHGTPISQFVRELFSAAILKRCAYVAIDFPVATEDVASLADEDSSGASRAYLISIPAEEMVDWEHEDDETQLVEASPDLYESQCVHGYSFVVLRRIVNVRGSPEEKRGMVCQEFKIWRKNDDGSVTWEVYRTKPYDPKQHPNEDQAFRPDDLIDRVIAPQMTSFTRIPIVELEVPDGLWVGNKIGPLAIEHWRRRSMLVASENRSLLELMVVKLGPQVLAPGGPVQADVAQDQQRGDGDTVARQARSKGAVVLSSEDSLEFKGPTGAAWKFVDDQLENLIREMHRTVHQMAMSVNNNSSALVRSGVSKQEDRLATSVIMSAYADVVRDFARRLYATISEARKEKVIWTVHGLDDYERPDRLQMFNEAAQEDTLNIPSPTYKKLRKYEIAIGMLMTRPSPETRLQIKREVDEGVEAEIEMTAAMRAAGEDPNAAPPTGSIPGVPGPPSAVTNTPKPSGGNGGDGGNDPSADAGTPNDDTGNKLERVSASAAQTATIEPNAHLRASNPIVKTTDAASAGIAESVYKKLSEDYDEDEIAWVRSAHWRGPLSVPLNQIDFTNKDRWVASQPGEQSKVRTFIQKIRAGEQKPVILVNEPSDDKLLIVDGHHRALAAAALGKPLLAYVADVGAVGGSWGTLHASQKSGASG